MKRRSVIIGGLAALLPVPERASAQQPPAKIPRVGVLTTADSDRTRLMDAFREGLRDLGYVEGHSIILEFGFARGDLSRGPQLAAEMVALRVDVIVTEGFTLDAVAATDRIPIVAPALRNPCGERLRGQSRAAGREYYRLYPHAHRAQRQASGAVAH